MTYSDLLVSIRESLFQDILKASSTGKGTPTETLIAYAVTHIALNQPERYDRANTRPKS